MVQQFWLLGKLFIARRFLNKKLLLRLVILIPLLSLFVVFKHLPITQASHEKTKFLNLLKYHLNATDLSFTTKENPILETDFHKNIMQTNVLIDPEILAKKNHIKNMTMHAWKGYKRYAWGKNELKPLSRRGHSTGELTQ